MCKVQFSGLNQTHTHIHTVWMDYHNSSLSNLCALRRQHSVIQPTFTAIVHMRPLWIQRDSFPTENCALSTHERCFLKCLNNTCNVRNKSVSPNSIEPKLVFIPRLYLTGCLLLGVHSCGVRVYHRRRVCRVWGQGKGAEGSLGSSVSLHPVRKCLPDITSHSVY